MYTMTRNNIYVSDIRISLEFLYIFQRNGDLRKSPEWVVVGGSGFENTIYIQVMRAKTISSGWRLEVTAVSGESSNQGRPLFHNSC